MYIIANGRVITRDFERPFIDNGGVAVDGTRIIEVANTEQLLSKYRQAEFIDAQKGVIMPGYIDAHCHMYRSMARGLYLQGDYPSPPLALSQKLWWKIDGALSISMCKLAAYSAIIESIKNGITTVFDHHASYRQPSGSLLSIASAVREIGIRACLSFEVSDRAGPDMSEAAIDESIDFIEYISSMNGNKLRALFGLHSSYTLCDNTISKCILGNVHNAGYHLHLCEGLDDTFDALHQYGKSAVSRLYDFGILNPNSIAAHCTHLSDDEIALISQSGVNVAITPAADSINGSGFADLNGLLKAGIKPCIGSDSRTSNMPENIRAFIGLLQYSKAPSERFGHMDAACALEESNALLASRVFNDDIGKLRRGAAADVIVVDYIPSTPFSEKNASVHMLSHASSAHCSTVMIGGALLMYRRKLLFADENELCCEVKYVAKKLWESIGLA